MRLPASPLSFSSYNISVSCSSVMDGSSLPQQSSNEDPNSQQLQHNQQCHGTSSSTSLPTSSVGQVQLANGLPNGQGLKVPGSFIQDPVALSQMDKKPRLDINQEDILQQQVLQQLLQRRDPLHIQNPSLQLQALVQQQRLRQQQHQLLQYLPPIQRAQLLPQQQLQLGQQVEQQSVQPVSGMKHPSDVFLCSKRLMQYLYHQRQRPTDNSIAYWRKFVAEYYSPRAKKRWCFSFYENVGHHSLGLFPRSTMDAWHCDICGSKSGRGFGLMMLEYAKAVQESVYEQLRVVQEGQLQIIFASDLKILSWEFCARRHEVLLPRRLVAPQVNQLLEVVQKCQSTSQQDLQANSNMVITTGRQLSKSMELQSLNDLGLSKRYVRFLQTAEAAYSMKDLMDICMEHKAGPLEGLKSIPRHGKAAKLETQNIQETEQQMVSIHGLPTDHNALDKFMSLHPGLNSQISNNQHLGGWGEL